MIETETLFFNNLKTTVSYDRSPPTKLIITDYKKVPKYAKNVAIKCSLQTPRYKDSPVPTQSLLPDMLPQTAT